MTLLLSLSKIASLAPLQAHNVFILGLNSGLTLFLQNTNLFSYKLDILEDIKKTAKNPVYKTFLKSLFPNICLVEVTWS